MDETRATYGTTNEVVVTLVGENGTEKSFKLPTLLEATDVAAAAADFAAVAVNSDTAYIGVTSEADGGLSTPLSVTVDLVTTTRTKVYGSNL